LPNSISDEVAFSFGNVYFTINGKRDYFALGTVSSFFHNNAELVTVATQ